MVTHVVDTNIPLVANGSCAGVSARCRLAVIDFLEGLIHTGKIAIDIEGLIEEEYRTQLGTGRPGIGNRFLQKFFTEAAHRVVRVSATIDRHGHCRKLKFDGTLKRFDRSDRKFVAVALETSSTIYNATDSDWLEHKDELEKKGVRVEFLCGCRKSDWFV